MQAVVLAGGLGTRLRSRVADRPKPMALVAGRPFLEYVLDWLDAGGCTSVALATGYLSEMIESHFGARYRGMAITYSREESPLGTGGAIVQALAQLPSEPTLVLNGDTWVGLDLRAFMAWCGAAGDGASIALRQVPDTSRYARVVLDGERIVAFGEPSQPGSGLINAGIYWLRPHTLAGWALPRVFSIENDFFRPHAARLQLRGFVTGGQFIDIGVPEDYDRAQTVLPQWTRGQ